ncbi:hypothetical protein PYW08_004234 [Mythimna loreyi]|uniref:Uncharacterized protein n=1 Tax=Mythimna loreyi TaxID=667449 RepID=A0ACC2QQV2_9NEOP|nr:hypothetical protein PYW08_004234 [Mythimna loreyi]
MSKTLLRISLRHLDQAGVFRPTYTAAVTMSSKAAQKNIATQKAAINEKINASDKTLMKKERYRKKRNIKTIYGFERMAEDLIQESVSKGEFENLSGTGKPLKTQIENPYVDFMTQKLNEVLINNGFTPEWITLAKEIDEEIDSLKQEIRSDRMPLGPYPLSQADLIKWEKICELNRDIASSINIKINKYNMIVPLLNKQKVHVEFDKICEDILKNGVHSVVKAKSESVGKTEYVSSSDGVDLFGAIFKTLGDLITFKQKKNS